jgi:queuine tRNA-ribosyltransferase
VRAVFELLARSGGARAGRLTTLHGVIDTPVFMPVGTRGTVRTQTLPQLEQLGAPMLLANTYHLMLRPGIEVFHQFGGLHRFMGWGGSILTDSGGFQVFSLAHARTIDDAGAAFQAVADGPRTVLSPERSIEMQRALGSDVMMVMDHCIDATCSPAEAREAMERTHRWARRSLAAKGDSAQQLFAIVQGARFPELRRESALELTSIDGFDGYAIGGLAVGEEREEREAITALVTALLPEDRPRYLMGVGTPHDILEAVHRGVDMFDCILPTAWAQHGRVFTSTGELDLRKGLFKLADEALDPSCPCEACTRYSRGYLHHLVKCQEPLGWQLLANHNLHYYVRMMADIRAAIASDGFGELYAARRRS